jgi:hypothetical protein
MRQFLAGLIAGAAALMALGGLASAATRTITGRLVDAACYKFAKSNTGIDHKLPQGDEKDCAVECVRTGLPVGLLTPEGKLYIVTGDLSVDNSAKLVPFMRHAVTITGDVTELAGAMTIDATDLKIVSK